MNNEHYNTEQLNHFLTGIGNFYWTANMDKFCEICGFRNDWYGEEKWRQWQELHKALTYFDQETLMKLVQAGHSKEKLPS
ncbi:hypothetical protein WA1_49095 [Scytonema hofmannii PCC 7110]|uniref:Uncharacterized protein n=1 Tax=Scytonema hofmannii PCC 7110 TaxID=128403 RepID=A0A139WQJ1_9CYAN|nr:hypothetical protein [Scytonema hofmannii]KYC34699.1 hypothetical protein WA1_49095 [Scytonema hofmannii PCC 7110]